MNNERSGTKCHGQRQRISAPIREDIFFSFGESEWRFCDNIDSLQGNKLSKIRKFIKYLITWGETRNGWKARIKNGIKNPSKNRKKVIKGTRMNERIGKESESDP